MSRRTRSERFFAAFQAHDLKGLEAAYHPDAKFKDDMFDLTRRSSILKMWEGAPPFKGFKAEILGVLFVNHSRLFKARNDNGVFQHCAGDGVNIAADFINGKNNLRIVMSLYL